MKKILVKSFNNCHVKLCCNFWYRDTRHDTIPQIYKRSVNVKVTFAAWMI